jgi:hypothetical protein
MKRAESVLGAPLFTPRLHGGGLGEIRREIIRIKRLHLQRDQADRRHTELSQAVGTIHHHADCQNIAAIGSDNIKRLLDATAFGHDVFHDENLFAGCNFEAAAQYKFPLLLLHKNKAQPQLPCDFLPNNQTAHGRSDNCYGVIRFKFSRQHRAEFFNDGHLLQGEGALKELPAVQTAAEDEMPFEQRARVAENLENFVLCHFGKCRVTGDG